MFYIIIFDIIPNPHAITSWLGIKKYLLLNDYVEFELNLFICFSFQHSNGFNTFLANILETFGKRTMNIIIFVCFTLSRYKYISNSLSQVKVDVLFYKPQFSFPSRTNFTSQEKVHFRHYLKK